MVFWVPFINPNKIGLFNIVENHTGDRDEILYDSTFDYKYVGTGNGAYTYDEDEQTFANVGAGNGDYSYENSDYPYTRQVNSDDVEAEIISSNIYIEDILGVYSFVKAFLRTGVINGQFTLSEDVDSFTVGNAEEITLNFYIDSAEINDSVSTARVNGTREDILHEIPLHGGKGSGQTLKINATNEGEFYELRLVPNDFGDRSEQR